MSHPHQRAIEFLAGHGGSCSVPVDHAFADAFRDLQQVGKVLINPSSTKGIIDVYVMPGKGECLTATISV